MYYKFNHKKSKIINYKNWQNKTEREDEDFTCTLSLSYKVRIQFEPFFFFLFLLINIEFRCCIIRVHSCIHDCGAPAFLDHLDRQKELLGNLAVHPTHHPYAHEMLLADVEGECLLWMQWPERVLQLLPSLCGCPLKLHQPKSSNICDISCMCKCIWSLVMWRVGTEICHKIGKWSGSRVSKDLSAGKRKDNLFCLDYALSHIEKGVVMP